MDGVSDFDRLGAVALRAIIDDFVDRVRKDAMIGFFFARIDLARLRELEYQHAAEHLGGPVRYEGRPLREAHAPHRIMGGQFARRREILRQTLEAHGAPPDVAARWLAHVDSLRGQVTADPGSECR
jgi:hemoglobin